MKKFGLLLLFLSLLLNACEDVSDEYVEDIFDEPVSDKVDDGAEDVGVDTAVSPSTSTFQFTDCPFDAPGGDIECGTLTVPEDRSDASAPTIELAVAIVAAPDGATEPPFVYLAGGPGGSGIDD